MFVIFYILGPMRFGKFVICKKNSECSLGLKAKRVLGKCEVVSNVRHPEEDEYPLKISVHMDPHMFRNLNILLKSP